MLPCLVATILLAGETKVAVTAIEAGEGVPEKTGAAIAEAVIAEVRRHPNVTVVTPSEIATLLGFERQQQLLGCKDDSGCMAEVGSALGVDRLLTGSLAKVGQSWLVHLKLIDLAKGAVVSQSDRRLKGKGVDDVLDALPQMVAELLGRSLPVTALVAARPPGAPPSSAGASREPGGADEPYGTPPAQLRLLHDGKGHYLAVTPYAGMDTVLFAGDGRSFWQQRIGGGGAEGTIRFDVAFWDPRFPSGYQRSFEYKDGKYTLQCGEARHSYEPVPPEKAAAIFAKAKLYKPRWRRALHALSRDDSGNYYVVDGPREENDESRKLRLFVGPRGNLREIPLDDAIQDSKGLLLISAEGRLRIPPRSEQAEWIAPSGKLELANFEIGPREGKLVYAELGLYQGEPLGTACDPYAPRPQAKK